MEASLEGINSIAFSLLDFSWDANFESAKSYIRKIILQILKNGMPEGCKLLNVNIPDLPSEKIKGVKICRQAEGRWEEIFHEAKDPQGVPYYWLTGEFRLDDNKEGNDIWALENGYISIVPSGHDLTVHQALEELKALEQ